MAGPGCQPERERGGGDADQAYRFGQPATYLSLRQRVRLLVLRSCLEADAAGVRYRPGGRGSATIDPGVRDDITHDQCEEP